MFAAVNEQHEDFNNGERIEAITVDFSDAEANGLEEPLGKEMASKVLRGCKVNFVLDLSPIKLIFLLTSKAISKYYVNS